LNEKAPSDEKKLLPIIIDQVERYVYKHTDSLFMPEFINESFKNNAFFLNGNQLFIQIAGGIVMFAELYFAILSAVHQDVAPIFSVFVALYALMSITCYFSVNIFRLVTIAQSYLATTVLASVSLGYLFQSMAVGNFNTSISFLILTILLAVDSFLGYALLSVRIEFTGEKKIYKHLDSAFMTFFFDNWKSNQYKSDNAILKNLAFILTSIEMSFAVSSLFVLGGVQVISIFNLCFIIVNHCYCCHIPRLITRCFILQIITQHP
jgi:hypothetical protein